eukprot:TRINITY_DN820_c0_g1_i1.p1 TRINITY_DN820_c0_g1~~TRINITY_DN820_c0_g1_i1.p1  ORF type:complete len:111 (+),score=13.76 TRINITY_DN820_c0_g1_i1:29-361(+)
MIKCRYCSEPHLSMSCPERPEMEGTPPPPESYVMEENEVCCEVLFFFFFFFFFFKGRTAQQKKSKPPTPTTPTTPFRSVNLKQLLKKWSTKISYLIHTTSLVFRRFVLFI